MTSFCKNGTSCPHERRALILLIHAELHQATLWTVIIPPCWPSCSHISWDKLKMGVREIAELHQFFVIWCRQNSRREWRETIKKNLFCKRLFIYIKLNDNNVWYAALWAMGFCYLLHERSWVYASQMTHFPVSFTVTHLGYSHYPWNLLMPPVTDTNRVEIIKE
jgi:hypothetical protein